MKIGVCSQEDQWNEIRKGVIGVEFARLSSLENAPADMDAYLWLTDGKKVGFEFTSKPIFINSVCTTLKEMSAPSNVVRINGWNGFLPRQTWELSGLVNETVQQVCTALGRTVIPVPDEPGFISARVIAMVINEAFFALEENISTRDEIDIAMKLGTNYPYGPFEWAGIIGEARIFELLHKLSLQDKRYLPATILNRSFT